MLREEFEREEHERLSKYATFSDQSRGRDVPEEECDLRPCFQRDRDRIIHCKSFRRLKHKTQVFLAPYGDHYRTRLTHTLEVAQIARTIAKSLRVNEELTEAIALGHDLGHTPFGHAGERALSEVTGRRFAHNEQSVRVVERLEKDGKGLNLTWEVRDGILNHKSSGNPATIEGDIVRVSDKIGYVNHDIDDGIRAGVLSEDMLPSEFTDILGHSTRDRIDNLIHSIVYASQDSPKLVMETDMWEAMIGLRKFMFNHLYTNYTVKGEESKAEQVLKFLYEHYMDHTEEMPSEYRRMIEEGDDQSTVVCDYIAGMTDNYSVECFERLYIPHAWTLF